MIHAALVGPGNWGQRLVNSVQAEGAPQGALQFTHVVSRTPSRIAEFATRQKLNTSESLDRVLGDTRVDAVVLATPHSLHVGQILQSLEAGKHVFVEKPMVLTASDARRCAELAARKSLVLAVGLSRRFLPAMPVLCDVVRGGSLGTVLHVEGVFSQPYGFAFRPGNWRLDPSESPVGGLTSMGIHVIDAFINLHGRIAEVEVRSTRRVLDVPLDDLTVCNLRFESGAFGYIAFMPATARCWRLQVFGERGWAQMPDSDLLEFTMRPDFTPIAPRRFEPVNTETRSLSAFAAACSGENPFPVPLDEVVHGIEVLEAITRAYGDKRPVRVATES